MIQEVDLFTINNRNNVYMYLGLNIVKGFKFQLFELKAPLLQGKPHRRIQKLDERGHPPNDQDRLLINLMQEITLANKN